MEIKFRQVPPPDRAPLHKKGEELGLVRGLRPEVSDHQFRCAECHRMQPRDSVMVWVPDGIRIGDPAWSVEESCRVSAFNGGSSGWCLKCARQAGGSHTSAALIFFLCGVLAAFVVAVLI